MKVVNEKEEGTHESRTVSEYQALLLINEYISTCKNDIPV